MSALDPVVAPPGPRFHLPETSAPAANAAPTTATAATPTAAEPRELTTSERNRLRALARQRVSTGHSGPATSTWLQSQGMAKPDAEQFVAQAAKQAASRKVAAQAEHRNQQMIGWVSIIGGIGLLIAGLAAGWFVGLFIVPIIYGFKQLAS